MKTPRTYVDMLLGRKTTLAAVALALLATTSANADMIIKAGEAPPDIVAFLQKAFPDGEGCLVVHDAWKRFQLSRLLIVWFETAEALWECNFTYTGDTP